MRRALPIDEQLWARMKALDAVADFCIERITPDEPPPAERPNDRRGQFDDRAWRVRIVPRDGRPGEGVSYQAMWLRSALERAVRDAEILRASWSEGTRPPGPTPGAAAQ
jgi:hypothetical protein